MLKVAIIGAGTMGGEHARCYNNIPEVEVTAIVDIILEKAQALAVPYNAKTFSDWEAMIKECQFDIVDVCVPTTVHKDFVLKAVEADKHIFCEKPLARTIRDGEEMLKAVEGRDKKFMVGHVLRFFPEFSNAKMIIDGGLIGEPKMVRTARGSHYPPKEWYSDFEISGGPILDMIIHDFDFLRWCFGDVQRAYAKCLTFREDLGKLDYGLVTLRFKNRLISHTAVCWAYPPGTFKVNFEICGTEGMITFDSQRAIPLMLSRTKIEPGKTDKVAVPSSPLFKNPYQLELEHFIDCLKRDEEPRVSGKDALESLRISLAAIESAQSGNPVSVPDFSR